MSVFCNFIANGVVTSPAKLFTIRFTTIQLLSKSLAYFGLSHRVGCKASLSNCIQASLFFVKTHSQMQNGRWIATQLKPDFPGLQRASKTPHNNSFAQNPWRDHDALTTRLRSAGQSPIAASISSPARIGPTPDGVPVKIKSPGKRVSDWLAKDIISATE